MKREVLVTSNRTPRHDTCRGVRPSDEGGDDADSRPSRTGRGLNPIRREEAHGAADETEHTDIGTATRPDGGRPHLHEWSTLEHRAADAESPTDTQQLAPMAKHRRAQSLTIGPAGQRAEG